MIRKCLGHEGVEALVHIVRQSDVVFLVDGLQFGVESADDHVLEAVALNLGPVLNLVAGNVLGIAGHVVAGERIGTLGSDGGHQLVVFVRDEILGCHLRDRVDFVVFLLAKFGVFDEAVFLVAAGNLVEQRFLGLGIVGAELLGTLKHQVLQIVSQTGGLGGVVLGTRAHGDVGLDARLLLVDGQIHFQSVVESVDAALHGIACNRLILVVFCTHAHSEHQECHC